MWQTWTTYKYGRQHKWGQKTISNATHSCEDKYNLLLSKYEQVLVKVQSTDKIAQSDEIRNINALIANQSKQLAKVAGEVAENKSQYCE